MKTLEYIIYTTILFLLMLLSSGLYKLSGSVIFLFLGGFELIFLIPSISILLLHLLSAIQKYFDLYNERKKKRKRMEKINTEIFSNKL